MSEYRKLPPLNAVRAFEAAGRLGSFTAASKELLVSPGAISRHVSNLEDYFEAELFWRRHHEIGLTQLGQEFMEKASASLKLLEQATKDIKAQTGSKQLRVKALPTFATRWLIPRLSRFNTRYPAIEVQLTTSVLNIGLSSGDADIIVASEPTEEPAAHSKFLFKTRLIPVCSPRLLAQRPALGELSGLKQAVLLHSIHRPHDWADWLALANAPDLSGRRDLRFGNSELSYQAALDSVGVACAQYELVQEDIEAGRLVAPFDLFLPVGVSYYLNVRETNASRPKVKAFHDWLLSECATTS